jgi:hypothetical protein
MTRSYYCSNCALAWPAGDEYKTCPDCGQFTFADTTTEPDVALAAIDAAKTAGSRTAYEWRVERYAELGFTEAAAHLLAAAKHHEHDSKRREWTRPLNWQRVAAALDNGCTHTLAVAIFS